jgi:hypothetical protein
MAVDYARVRNHGLKGVALAALFLMQGCILAVEDDEDDEPLTYDDSVVLYEDGSLILDWTIDGSKDPFECTQSDVDQIHIVIAEPGYDDREFEQDCEAFETEIPLPPGEYDGYTWLLDFDGNARTTELDLGVLSIFEGESRVIEIDFPSDSFLF